MRGLTLADPAFLGGQTLSATAARRNYLLELTESPNTEVGIQRVSATRYQLFQKLEDPYYWLIDVGQSGSNPISEILYLSIGQLRFSLDDALGLGSTTSVDQENAQFARSGTWTAASNAAAYGGSYRYSTGVGNYTEFTPTVACVAMGLRAFKTTNGGVAKATIDGDTSKCNLLPTAQELVDNGVISGLGSLSASDRCVVFYSATTSGDTDVPVASGLTLGSHTLRLTVTNITPTGSSSTRTYDSGAYYATTASGTSVVHIGAWTNASASSAYGGAYKYTTTTGSKVVVSYIGTDIGVRTVKSANAGICKVKVDGSLTAANQLPTAQDLVDAGDMSSLYLTPLGPLAPTDRVLDLYRNNTLYDEGIQIASELTDGAHTIELICTTARNVAASSNRLYSSGYTYSTDDISFDDAGAQIVAIEAKLAEPSALEYAYNFGPSGAGTHQFIGNIHGSDQPISLTVEVDGAPVTMSDGDVEVGTEVVVRRVSELRYPTTGTTKYADIDLTYTVTQNGMVIDHTDTWAADVVMYNADSHMYTVTQETFTKASIVGADVDYTMNAANPSDLDYGHLESDCAYMWEGDGNTIALLVLLDVPAQVDNWQYTTENLYVQDRAGGKFTKTYLARNSTARTVPAGTVWTNSALYRMALVDNVDALVAH